MKADTPLTTPAYNLMSLREGEPDGWAGGLPRGIATVSWPRSYANGVPLLHVLTLRLPPSFRAKAEDLVGFALFQDDNLFVRDVQGVPEVLGGRPLSPKQVGDPFWESLARAAGARHPREVQMCDSIGGAFVLIWLTEAELAGSWTEPPEILLPPRVRGSAWDRRVPTAPLQLSARLGDPNAGIGPHEAGYVPWIDLPEETWLRLAADEILGHLGGTAFPVQEMPEKLTGCYLELQDRVCGVNFGGGRAQIDLARETIDWACD